MQCSPVLIYAFSQDSLKGIAAVAGKEHRSRMEHPNSRKFVSSMHSGASLQGPLHCWWAFLTGTNSCANGRALALIYYLEHFALYRFLTVNPTFFLNTCFTAARPKLRRSVARVVRIDKHNDGQYILCYNKHFVAFRILDGDAEINFTHKSHAWKKCWVSSCVTKPVEFHANLGAYVDDESLLDGLFQICSACHLPAPVENDLVDGAAVLRKLQFLHGSAGPWGSPCTTSAVALGIVLKLHQLSQETAYYGFMYLLRPKMTTAF